MMLTIPTKPYQKQMEIKVQKPLDQPSAVEITTGLDPRDERISDRALQIGDIDHQIESLLNALRVLQTEHQALQTKITQYYNDARDANERLQKKMGLIALSGKNQKRIEALQREKDELGRVSRLFVEGKKQKEIDSIKTAQQNLDGEIERIDRSIALIMEQYGIAEKLISANMMEEAQAVLSEGHHELVIKRETIAIKADGVLDELTRAKSKRKELIEDTTAGDLVAERMGKQRQLVFTGRLRPDEGKKIREYFQSQSGEQC